METLYKHTFSNISIYLALLANLWTCDVHAQNTRLYLELQLNRSLNHSQVINMTHIIANKGKGQNLFSLFLQNEGSAEARNLYLSITMKGKKAGTIAEIYQRQGKPFSLNGGQRVYTTNNTLENGLPGVTEHIEFRGGLTSRGEDFINKLGGSTNLPPDQYIFELAVYQGGNNKSGGIQIASDQVELGGDIIEDVRDIFLTSPGNVVGSETEIINPYPEFRWEGKPGTTYRLIIVEARGQDSPESLLQGAASTEPFLVNGHAGMGTLLDYEIVDARLQKTNFQFPPSGVQNLEPGKHYYWQVHAELNTSGGTETRASEIWGFILAGQGGGQAIPDGEELDQVLKQLIGEAQFQQLKRSGFTLRSIRIDGKPITGPAALERLVELRDNLNQGNISIITN